MNNNNNNKMKSLEEENKRLKDEIKVWKNICTTLEKIESNLLSKISLMKFECDVNESHFDLLCHKYNGIEFNLIKLNTNYRKFKLQLIKFKNLGKTESKKLSQKPNKTSNNVKKTIVKDSINKEFINNKSLSIAGTEDNNRNDSLGQELRKNRLDYKRVKTKKSLVCDYNGCGQRFYRWYVLEAHKSMHSNGYSYSCEWPGCGQHFNIRHHYLKHKLKHCSEGKYVCDWPGCQYRSWESSAIKNHKRVHTNERPFECSQCPMKFKIKQHLNKHNLQHTGEKPFECEFAGCERRFTSISYMRAHLRKRHTNS